RIRAALRRANRSEVLDIHAVMEFGNIKVDQAKRRVYIDEGEVHLTPIEFKLLSVLLKHKGKVLTHNQLLIEVWGPGYMNENQYLRVYMAQLRKKLEKDPSNPSYFLTEPGVGYRLKDD